MGVWVHSMRTHTERGIAMTFTTTPCAACGLPVAEALSRLGSVRCHDCRDLGAPLSEWTAPEATLRARELAHREAEGIEVTLLWYAEADQVAVRVSDARTGDRFELRIDAAAALDAFHHPFAYAPPPLRENDGADCALAYAEAA
jgi:hypothetical protein